mgnify:CR=1 FL=1|nr:MAG TPA: hypothetical protein [Caudoviricetes sp.]
MFEEFDAGCDQLRIEYIEKMRDAVRQAREQNVSTEEVASRLNELLGEYADKYQRLAFNTHKCQHLKF